MIGNGKDLGGVGMFLAKKWVDKVINISRVSDRIIANKVLVQRILMKKLTTVELISLKFN